MQSQEYVKHFLGNHPCPRFVGVQFVSEVSISEMAADVRQRYPCAATIKGDHENFAVPAGQLTVFD
jgi:hypothetical protein